MTKIMKKPTIDIAVVLLVTLLWAGSASAGTVPAPDGGATSLLFVASLAGLAAVRKFLR